MHSSISPRNSSHGLRSSSAFWDEVIPLHLVGDAAAEASWLEAKLSRVKSEASTMLSHEPSGDSLKNDPNAPPLRSGRKRVRLHRRSSRPSILDTNYVERFSQVVSPYTQQEEDREATRLKLGAKVEKFSQSLRAEDYIEWNHLRDLQIRWNEKGQRINRDLFISLLREIVQPRPESEKDFDQEMALLFYRMDANSDGTVDWDEFCTHLMHSLEERFQVEHQRDYPLLVCPRIFPSPHHHDIIRIQYVEESMNRFFSFDAHGTVCVWSMKMDLVRTIHLSQLKIPGCALEVTDAVFLPCCNAFIVSTTNAELRFYDAATEHICKIVLVGDLVTALSTWWSEDDSTSPQAIVAFGTIGGAIHKLSFSNATRLSTMFNSCTPRFSEDNVKIKLADIEKNLKLPVAVRHRGFIAHVQSESGELNQSVGSIQLSSDGALVFSCSKSWRSGLVVTRVDKFAQQGMCTVRVREGVDCFDHSAELNQVATAGKDGVVRLWNPYVPTHTEAQLKDHGASVVALQFNAVYNQLITLTVNEAIRVWDLKQQICLNALADIIPHKLVVKHTAKGMLWHTWTQSLITLTKDEIAVIQMTRDLDRQAFAVTDSHSILCMCVTLDLNLLVTGSSSGVLATWKFDTGEKVKSFGEDRAAITAICPGNACARVVSGNSHGQLLIWNIVEATILHVLQLSVPAKEISGVICFKNVVFASGCNRRIAKFLVPDETSVERYPARLPEEKLTESRVLESDMTCIVSLADSYVITGAQDGTVAVWDFCTGSLVQSFNCSAAVAFSQKQQKWSIHLPPVQDTVDPSVTALLSLEYRVTNGLQRKREMAYVSTLVVSSDNGTLHFFQPVIGTLLGSFRVSARETHNDLISTLATNSTNSNILTGDSQGYVSIFDIEGVCMRHPPRRSEGLKSSPTPELTNQWRAHAQPITAIQLIEHSTHPSVITAAADSSVRLWTTTGEYLGTYGTGMYRSMAKAVQLYQNSLEGSTSLRSNRQQYVIENESEKRGSQSSTVGLPEICLPRRSQTTSLPPRQFAQELLNRKSVVAKKTSKHNEENKNENQKKKALTRGSVLGQSSVEDTLARLETGRGLPKLKQQRSKMGDENAFEFTRSRLGRAFDIGLLARCEAKKHWRDATPRPDTSKSILPGTNICKPFSALGLDRLNLEDIVLPKQPREQPKWGFTHQDSTVNLKTLMQTTPIQHKFKPHREGKNIA